MCSYDKSLQELADSEAKRETAEKELKVVSTYIHTVRQYSIKTSVVIPCYTCRAS